MIREVVAAGRFYGLYYLNGEAVAVLEASAVFVCAEVGIFHGELVQQVALMHRVHLDTVHSGVLAELGGLGEGLYHLVNLFCGEGRDMQLSSQRLGVALALAVR